MQMRHAAVWIDHKEARIFHVTLKDFDVLKIAAPERHIHRHPKGTGEPKGHPADTQHFYQEVAHALADAEEVLVVGPARAKLELIKHIYAHDKGLASRIVGVETVDHPTDGQLAKYARAYFQTVDRMLGLAP